MLISAKDIILQSIDLYKKNTYLFVKYMLFLFIPTGIIAILGVVMGSIAQMIFLYGFTITIISYMLLIIGGLIISLWISMAFIKTINAVYNQKKVDSIKDELIKTRPLILTAIIAYILNVLIVLGGFILLIIPGIIFSIWFIFAIYSIAIDNNNNAIDALKKSKALVQGRWFETLWLLIIPGIVFSISALIIQAMVGWPLNYILESMGENSFTFLFLSSLSALLSVIISLIFTPLTTAAPTILFIELKKTPLEPGKILPPDKTKAPTEPPAKQ